MLKDEGRSLYKALLQTCARFNSPILLSTGKNGHNSSLASGLQALVRFRYGHDRKLQSPKQICNALEYGRQSLQTLHSASQGSASALRELTEKLSEAHDLALSTSIAQEHCDKDKGRYAIHVLKKKEYIRTVTDPTTFASPKPGSIPILSRPVPLHRIKSAKRRWPRLIVTHGIPFLSYYRKQSRTLSLYLRGIIRRKAKRTLLLRDINASLRLARHEDAWDAELRRRHGILDHDTSNQPARHQSESLQSTSWDEEFVKMKHETTMKDMMMTRKHMAWGDKLYKIMVAERELAEEEQREAKRRKRRSKIKAKAARDMAVEDQSQAA